MAPTELLVYDEEVAYALGLKNEQEFSSWWRPEKGSFPQRRQYMKIHDLVKDSKHPRVAGACGIEVDFCWTPD